MDFITSTAAIMLAVLILAMTMAVLDGKFKLPLLFECGMSFVILGFVGALDALINNSACTSDAVTLRWALVGGGTFIMLLSVVLTLQHQHQVKPCRATDESFEDYRLVRHKSPPSTQKETP